MQFAAYLVSPHQSPGLLISIVRDLAKFEYWLISDIDPDEAIHLCNEAGLSNSDCEELIKICDYAIENTYDTVVKKPHWEILRSWLQKQI